MRPYAITSATSGERSPTHSCKLPVLTLTGWCTSSPSSRAATFTAGSARCMPRPARRSGWHTTPTTSAISDRARSAGTAMAGVPKKMARMTRMS